MASLYDIIHLIFVFLALRRDEMNFSRPLAYIVVRLWWQNASARTAGSLCATLRLTQSMHSAFYNWKGEREWPLCRELGMRANP